MDLKFGGVSQSAQMPEQETTARTGPQSSGWIKRRKSVVSRRRGEPSEEYGPAKKGLQRFKKKTRGAFDWYGEGALKSPESSAECEDSLFRRSGSEADPAVPSSAERPTVMKSRKALEAPGVRVFYAPFRERRRIVLHFPRKSAIIVPISQEAPVS